jgi:NAD-dependent dihydropyrimidine dehydrogenase PreA subunit
MREARLTVVVSQGQSRNPDKRQLESEIAAAAAALPGVEVLVVPHLYDLARDGETYQRLRAEPGPMVVCAWLFDRATHWVLDRHGVRGQSGQVLLKESSDDLDEDADPAQADAGGEADQDRVIQAQPRPERLIYCIDLRVSTQASDFIGEIARIAELSAAGSWLEGQPGLAGASSFAAPTNDTYVGRAAPIGAGSEPTLHGTVGVLTIAEHPTRRWYPVIDFSRCTNCMECIDFCLFGVYGIDSVETILVEQPDNCRKGCPACSRVCPQNAIIFPQHKTPAIAGAPMDAGGLKIDLSKLFGAPDEGADALEVAARERDEQLLLAGRQAVGMSEELSARLGTAAADKPSDELDKLIDQLDSLEL